MKRFSLQPETDKTDNGGTEVYLFGTMWGDDDAYQYYSADCQNDMFGIFFA